ncbi:MAG: antitoxin VapB family protein, partial [Promethearchaeota archaeon]
MISIRDDIYKNLKKLKEPNESFSELIERLISNQQKNPLKHFG